jgi:hypothetical protein
MKELHATLTEVRDDLMRVWGKIESGAHATVEDVSAIIQKIVKVVPLALDETATAVEPVVVKTAEVATATAKQAVVTAVETEVKA